MNKLIKDLKENKQDYEFYPTTPEILKKVCEKLILLNEYKRERYKLLDIGAGDGSSLNFLAKYMLNKKQEENDVCLITKNYAIEKSKILIDKMPDDIIILGTDFYKNTLIDKNVDIIFCNPPYSDFENWIQKIINEANAKYLFFVIPERWKNNLQTQYFLKQRLDSEKAEYEILGHYDFLNSERKARCKVDLVFINLRKNAYTNSLITDPFDKWFNNNFKINASQEEFSNYEKEKKQKEKIRNELLIGNNLIERLEKLYIKDFSNLLNNYKQLENLNSNLLSELNVNIEILKEGLKEKIIGLKNLYWEELFNNLDVITNKLTNKTRKQLINRLSENTNIDYTSENAYSLVLYTIKQANKYIDQQLLDVYYNLTEPQNIKNYKSNKHILEDSWRYNRKKMTHYKLDYRLVLNTYCCFNDNEFSDYDYENGLYTETNHFLNDICTVGRSLGFNVTSNSFDKMWEPSKTEIFYLKNNDTFMKVKAYKKGTLHIKFNQEFLKKLNIEASRLNNWIKSPKEYSEETGENLTEVTKCFKLLNTNKLNISNIKLLTA